MKDIEHFKNVLKDNKSKICTALQLHFTKVLMDMPQLDVESLTLRIKFNSDPINAIAELFDMVALGDNEQLWYEFLKALDNNKTLQTCRRLFVPDDEWKG